MEIIENTTQVCITLTQEDYSSGPKHMEEASKSEVISIISVRMDALPIAKTSIQEHTSIGRTIVPVTITTAAMDASGLHTSR